MYIADAALYLESAQPSLDIGDPYELTQPQFDAAVQVLQQQRAQINSYWSSSAALVRDFTSGEVVLGQAGEQPYVSLEAAGEPVSTVIPDEGVTGWIESWMMSSQALHPDCMLKWMAYTATPIVQAAVRPLDRLGAGQPGGLRGPRSSAGRLLRSSRAPSLRTWTA